MHRTCRRANKVDLAAADERLAGNVALALSFSLSQAEYAEMQNCAETKAAKVVAPREKGQPVRLVVPAIPQFNAQGMSVGLATDSTSTTTKNNHTGITTLTITDEDSSATSRPLLGDELASYETAQKFRDTLKRQVKSTGRGRPSTSARA